MRCPHCKNHVLQKSGERTKLRIQGPVFFDRQGKCKATCFWCKSEVELPLRLLGGVPIESETFLLPTRG
jgi:hypothetical protein